MNYLLLDSCYCVTDRNEKLAFNNAVTRLWELLTQAPPLTTDKVKAVLTQSQQLKNKIEEMEIELVESAHKLWRQSRLHTVTQLNTHHS